jgi:hypothetical protein
MRSLALLRLSAATCGLAALLAAVAQVANLSLSIPDHQLRLAWTLARVLIQL